MTLNELHEIISRQLKVYPRGGDTLVCIPNNKSIMGGTSVTNVKCVGIGCDWDKNKFMLFPEKPMTEKT